MGDIIKVRKGSKVALDANPLLLGEFGFTTDEERVYIGGNTGNIPLPNATDLSEMKKDDAYSTDTGTVNNIVIADITPTAYKIGQRYRLKAKFANTGACTIKVGTLATTPIKKHVTLNLVTGDILANQIVTVVFDGTNFQIIPDFSTKFNNITSKQLSSVSNSQMLNGWTNATDEEWARVKVSKTGNIVQVFIYDITGTNTSAPIFTLPSFCNDCWFDCIGEGISFNGRNVYANTTRVTRRLITYIEP